MNKNIAMTFYAVLLINDLTIKGKKLTIVMIILRGRISKKSSCKDRVH